MALIRESITLVEIQHYKDILDSQGITAVSSIYQLLWDKGYAYGGWAYGVATGNTFTGQAALDFMQETAGRTFSSVEIDNIRVSMLHGYLGELLNSAAETGSTNQDLSFKITREYHKLAFEANNLTIDNWTLEVPMEMVKLYLGGEEEQERCWAKLRETEGDYLDALLGSADLYFMMLGMAGGYYLDDSDKYKYISADNPMQKGNMIEVLRDRMISINEDDVEKIQKWIKTASDFSPLINFIKQFFSDNYQQNFVVGDRDQDNQADIIAGTKKGDIIYGLGGNDNLDGGNGNDQLYGGAGVDTLYGGEGHDYLYGGESNDHLFGGKDNDYLNGGSGDDILDGGEGDDILVDESGNDTYIFNDNFGHDTIYDADGEGQIKINGTILKIGEMTNYRLWESEDGLYQIAVIKPDDIATYTYQLRIIDKNNANNSITVKYWKNGDLGLTLVGLENTSTEPVPDTGYFIANDGSNVIYDKQYIAAFDGNDYLNSTDDNDVIIAGDGGDLISSGDGKDTIYAGVAESDNDNDIIFAGLGEDTIYGGAGDDLLMTSATLIESRSIYVSRVAEISSSETDENKKNYNSQFFVEKSLDTQGNLISNYVWFSHYVLPALNIGYIGTDMHYLLKDFYSYFNDGKGFSGSDIAYGGTGDDIIIGSSDTDFLYGDEDDDNLYGLNGNDFLFGGTGHDVIYGGDGLDYIEGGDGDDKLIGGLGRDIILGGEGDDEIQGDHTHIDGVHGDDELYGGAGDDKIWGDAGNDKIWGQGGSDTIFGGEGDDEIQGDSSYLVKTIVCLYLRSKKIIQFRKAYQHRIMKISNIHHQSIQSLNLIGNSYAN